MDQFDSDYDEFRQQGQDQFDGNTFDEWRRERENGGRSMSGQSGSAPGSSGQSSSQSGRSSN